ncbi:P-loop containing nucleoside triphosphate hydrolase protein [Rhodocollybia butyracea]|uniref:P-loop containing nucleoside triphosphate hydrolase protein n=1 Tax=Rhodocollybia butyracea TaxID=206335 RepID=A0A9P5Q9P0_9AGAR|nr:P-loop containing nucleoside triphosphate hydrolase protein [Rhodocollybia butyracea]
MPGNVDESFVDDWDDFLPEMLSRKDHHNFHDEWAEQASAKHVDAVLSASELLRKLYPKHSMVSTGDFRLQPIAFPGVQLTPLEHNPLVTSLGFQPLNRSSAPVPGVLTDRIIAGGFTMGWQGKEFILHVVQYPSGFSFGIQSFILHEGSEEPARQLLLACGIWAESIHNEIWVFNQGFWQKDGVLWDSIQSADWKDVILKDEFKKAFQKDVYGFFDSKELYLELGIPWKRGLIMHGPPGNGKTITLKTVMKTCDAKGYAPLYVKSFQSFGGDEYSMQVVFQKARQLAPCVLILEDLDSLITDRNRSFFLNELDGLAGNEGLFVLATTNHFDRLDPGLSTRPSRFDRKYLFDDPTRDERALYAVYWQNKLKNNKSIGFPDKLVEEVADATNRFSFAYLKEAFVSALVTLAGIGEDEEKPSFASVLMQQIDVLRKQLDKPQEAKLSPEMKPHTTRSFSRPLPYPGRRTQHVDAIRRQFTNGADASTQSRVFVPPSPPLLPTFQPHDAPSTRQRKLDSDMHDLVARINALRVPGSFVVCDEDDVGLTLPSPPQSSSSSLPGIPGYWA